MTQTTETNSMLGRKVIYNGDNRPGLYGLVGTIERATLNSNTWGVRYDESDVVAKQYANDEGIVYGAVWAWDVQPDYQAEFNTYVQNSLDPHVKSITILDNEIKRLKAKVEELEAAKKVLKSL
jgi:hypothetical protein